MSNENQVPSTTNESTAVIPEYLKQMMGQGQTSAVDSMASASMSIPRVSMRGKKFRFVENGEEVAAFNDQVDVAILGVEPGPGKMIKTYYAKAYTGVQSSDPPDCASDDGIQPGAWVPNRQNPVCATCPKNVFGSATSRTGKPAKACRDSKRLWLVKGDEAQDPNATIYALQATVMSLRNLSAYGRMLKDRNIPIAAAVSRLIMVDESEFPMLDFKTVGFFKEEVALGLLSRAERAPWKMFTITPAQGAAQLPGNTTASLPGTTAAPAPSVQMSPGQVAQEVQQVQQPTPTTPPLQPATGPNVQSEPPAAITKANMGDVVNGW